MSGHTPGPWEFAISAVNGVPAKITTVAYCCEYVIGLPSEIPGGNYRDGDPSGTPEADARLIAAAPELLEACQQFLVAMRTSGASNGAIRAAEDAARAAIAKATQP